MEQFFVLKCTIYGLVFSSSSQLFMEQFLVLKCTIYGLVFSSGSSSSSLLFMEQFLVFNCTVYGLVFSFSSQLFMKQFKVLKCTIYELVQVLSSSSQLFMEQFLVLKFTVYGLVFSSSSQLYMEQFLVLQCTIYGLVFRYSSYFSSVLSMDQFLVQVLSCLWNSSQVYCLCTGSSSYVTIGWHLQENLVSVRYCCIRGWTRGGRGSKQITGYLQTNLRQNSRRFTGIHYNLVGYISQEGCIERSKMGLNSTFLRCCHRFLRRHLHY